MEVILLCCHTDWLSISYIKDIWWLIEVGKNWLRFLIFRKKDGPHLVVAPLSTLKNWSNEIARFCPSLKSVILHGDAKKRSNILHDMKDDASWNVCVTSYEMLVAEKGRLKRYAWEYVVIDEAQRMKNEQTIFSKELRRFRSENRLLLTGTPLQACIKCIRLNRSVLQC